MSDSHQETSNVQSESYSGSENYSGHYQSDTVAEDYEKYYQANEPDDIIWQVERRLLFKLIGRFNRDIKQANVLDFACGTGRILAVLDGKFRSLVGIDISAAMLERAKINVSSVDTICADILREPEKVPGNMDIITTFRFVLFADPELRDACIKQLATRLKDENSIMIIGIHGNPHSRRILAQIRNSLFGRPKMKALTLGDMRQLAERAGLQVVGATGCGFLPPSIMRRLPPRLAESIEQMLGGLPLLWRFGSNLLVACKKI